MTLLLERHHAITAASDDGVPLACCQAVVDTGDINIIEIKFDLHHKLHNK